MFRPWIPDDDARRGVLPAFQHPAEPHWHLFFLATRPGLPSRGLGSALMRPVLETCDAQSILPDGPSLWPMWREAQR